MRNYDGQRGDTMLTNAKTRALTLIALMLLAALAGCLGGDTDDDTTDTTDPVDPVDPVDNTTDPVDPVDPVDNTTDPGDDRIDVGGAITMKLSSTCPACFHQYGDSDEQLCPECGSSRPMVQA
mgnify:CR=1 FL=1